MYIILCMLTLNTLKRQSNKIFYLRFFHRWTPPKPLNHYLKTFPICLWIRGDVCNFLLTLLNYSWQRVDTHIMFNTESRDSPHHYSWESLFVRIICINSRLSLNTERWYSPYCLIWRVTTHPASFIVGSHCSFENFEGLPLPLKVHLSKKWTKYVQCRALLTNNIFKE